jgi:hypothetical protein
LEDLTVCTWIWGRKYSDDYIDRLVESVHRNLMRPFKFKVFSPQGSDIELTQVPGCFARLRAFDPDWQQAHGITGRLVVLDLDMVVTGPLDELFARKEPFVILQGVNAANPCKMNGSIWMLKAGYRPDVWADFSLKAASRVPFYSFPDDQAWLDYKIPDAAAFTSDDGVYAFKKKGWPPGDDLPTNAKIVAFPGWRDPSKFAHLKWVKEHWTRV